MHELRADVLPHPFVVEPGPDGGFALAGPEESQKAPVLGLGGAASGEGRMQERLHPLVGLVGLGDELPRLGLPLAQLAGGLLQKRFLDAETSGGRLKLDCDARREVGASGLQGFDFLALGGVAIEQGAGGSVERGGLARLVRGREHIEPRRKGAEADRLAEAADVVQLDRVQDHADTSCRV